MSSYYTANTFFIVFVMVIMAIATSYNTVLDRHHKMISRLLFILIGVAALCEWAGNALQGASADLIPLHILVKMIELGIAPYIGLLCGKSLTSSKWDTPLLMSMFVHSMLEMLSAFTGWIYYVDDSNYYHHSDFYWVYMLFYAVSIFYCLFEGFRSFRRCQQRSGLLIPMVSVFLVGSVLLTTLFTDIKVAWLAVAFSAIMLYKFHGDILQQLDSLTELLNRWGYEDQLRSFRGKGAILIFDVDRFKAVNDTYGHAQGDVCLCTVADGLREIYSKSGLCYRIGGDEFCVILRKNLDSVEQLNADFEAWLDAKRQQNFRLPTVSVGYVFFDTNAPSASVNEAVRKADEAMYNTKASRKAIRALS